MMESLKRCDLVGFAYLDYDGVILECNEKFANIQGDAPIHVSGKNVIDITSPEDRQRTVVNLQRLKSGEVDSVQHDKRYLARSGKTVNCRSQLVAVREGNDAYILSVAYEYDPKDSEAKRIAVLEDYVAKLLEVISRSQGISFNVSGNDNSQNATANNQSQATVTKTDTRETVKHPSVWFPILMTFSMTIGIVVIAILIYLLQGKM